LKDRQCHETITLPEEKIIIREIEDIEQSLPYAGPLDALN